MTAANTNTAQQKRKNEEGAEAPAVTNIQRPTTVNSAKLLHNLISKHHSRT